MTDRVIPLVKFTGKCMYAQVYPGQERPPHPKSVKQNPESADDRYYQITVECSRGLYDKLLKAGVSPMTKLREFDGKTFIAIKTAKKKFVKSRDEVLTFGDPTITDADGNTMTSDTLIGNGSEVVVEAELADGDQCKVLRLRSVKVTKLIQYIKPEVTTKVMFEDKSSLNTEGLF